MGVIDTDPEVLRRSADAALHAAEQTTIHIDAEIVGKVPGLMETLVPDGPYAYTIVPEINPDGTVRAPILTTRDEIRGAYEFVRGRSALLTVDPVVEVRGLWYTFHESVNTARLRETGELTPPSVTLAIFPVSTGNGITGELVWPWVPQSMLGRGDVPEGAPTEPREQRLAALALHRRYLDALRTSDVDALLATFDDDVQGGVRDYVNDAGTLTELQGKDEHRAYYDAFFDKFEIRSVELLHRVVQDWYVFAELRIVTATVAFHIAEFQVMSKDGRFIIRVGHGTDPA